MPIQVATIPAATIASLVEQMNRTGFGFLPDYISPDDLATMNRFVTTAVDKAGNTYVGFTGPDTVQGSRLEELPTAPAFRSLMENIYEAGTGSPAPASAFYQVLRCLTGKAAQRHSMMFHYDSYVVTALIPVAIPTEGRTGDLLMLPNRRGIRKSYAANLLDKLILDNRVTQFLLRHLTARNLLPVTRIKMVPGNAYFFWGYRSIHTNEACDAEKIRATALFHYANPHAGHGFGARLRGRRAAA